MGKQNTNAGQNAGTETVYKMNTPRGAVAGLNGIVATAITLRENDMTLFMSPKRLNKLPEIRYCDIASVEMKKSFSWFYAALSILAVVSAVVYSVIGTDPGVSIAVSVLVILLSLWLGRLKKIKITLKNSASTTVICPARGDTDKLFNDIKGRASAHRA